MVFGVVLHSLVEDKTFPIFYSHFFDIFGNDDMRVYREQAVASVVAKEYGFRSLCRVYSQVCDKIIDFMKLNIVY